MFIKSAVLFLPILLVAIPGCGTKWPPIVNTKRDIERLPVSQRSIRARGLADGDIPSLGRLRELRTLDFASGNAVEPARITDEGLAELAKLDLPHLESLSLDWCDEITDAGLAHIVRMQTIKTLHLDSCPKITDAGLRELVNAKNLTGLNLRGCPNITDEGIQPLAAKKNWERILLGGCPKITPQGVAKLQAALPNAPFVKKDDREWGFQAPHERSWRNDTRQINSNVPYPPSICSKERHMKQSVKCFGFLFAFFLTIERMPAEGGEGKPPAGVELVLATDKSTISSTDELNLKLWAVNHTERAILLNGRLLPTKQGKYQLEPLNTPIIVIFELETKEKGAKKEISRQMVRLRNVAEIPAQRNYKAPLFTSVDPVPKRFEPKLSVKTPGTVGRWSVQCQLIMPQPDPNDEKTMSLLSNRITIDIQKTQEK